MSKVICQHCQAEVSKSRISNHYKTKTCRQAQGLKPLEPVLHECQFCGDKVQNLIDHQKSFECRKYQPISSDCYFGVCPFCETDKKVLVDLCDKVCGTKCCRMCKQAPDECPECLEKVKEIEFSEQEIIDVLQEDDQLIKNKLEEILYSIGFRQKQVKRLKHHHSISKKLKFLIRELFICQNYVQRDLEFEAVFTNFIKKAFAGDQQYIMFEGFLVPQNEDMERIKVTDGLKQLTNKIPVQFF